MSKAIKTIRDLTPDDKNANRGTQRGSGFLEQSLEKFGAGRSILIDKNGRIIAGNKTVEGAASIGLEELIVVPTDGRQIVAVQRTDLDLDDPKTRELAVYDNRVGQVNLEWDVDVLAELAADGVELDALWSEDELSELLNDTQEPVTGAGGDEFEAEPDEAQTRVKVGDLWQCGRHRVLCGDSTKAEDVARLMDGEKADMVFTDPPYGMDLDTDYSKIKGTAKSPNARGYSYDAVTGDDRPFDFSPFANFDCKEQFWWGGDYYAQQLPMGGSWDVWVKRNEADSTMIGNDFELCWSKQRHKRHALRIRWVGWDATERGEKRAHPTQKPVELAVWFLEQYSQENGIIIDFYLGSGTTLIAAQRTNRKCYGIEISPKYVDVILKRYEAETGEAPVKVE